jgi:hypothetical protein
MLGRWHWWPARAAAARARRAGGPRCYRAPSHCRPLGGLEPDLRGGGLWQRIVDAIPGGYPDRPMCFCMLGSALRGLRPALSGMTGDFTELLQKTLPEPCPGDRGKAQGLHYVRSAQSFPTAPIVLRERPPASSAAVHSPVDSTGRHAGVAVCSLRIGVCVESVDNRRGGKFGQVSPGSLYPHSVRRENSDSRGPSTLAGSYPTLGISRTTSYAKPPKVAHRPRAMRPSGG